MTRDEYEAARVELEALMWRDPLADTPEGKRLLELAERVEAHERASHPELELGVRVAALDARIDELERELRASLAALQETKRRLREPRIKAPRRGVSQR